MPRPTPCKRPRAVRTDVAVCHPNATSATVRFERREMDTYVLLGCGFGLGLLIAIWGIWSLR
ncbi:hypothetical protein WL93_15515 [Burkholderia diffusa]|nr:hypothetical protein WJ39_11970 [Burkholderia diffusa]KWF89900.1 hypothetical protein WL93_15515 [Burkholderia diffusa]